MTYSKKWISHKIIRKFCFCKSIAIMYHNIFSRFCNFIAILFCATAHALAAALHFCWHELTNQLGAIVFGKMDEFLEKVQTAFEPLLLPPSFKDFLLKLIFFVHIRDGFWKKIGWKYGLLPNSPKNTFKKAVWFFYNPRTPPPLVWQTTILFFPIFSEHFPKLFYIYRSFSPGRGNENEQNVSFIFIFLSFTVTKRFFLLQVFSTVLKRLCPSKSLRV